MDRSPVPSELAPTSSGSSGTRAARAAPRSGSAPIGGRDLARRSERDVEPRLLRTLAAAVVLTAAALLPACASSDGAATGPDADRRFYEARCGVCHVPFGRSDYGPDEWPGIVAQFAPRAGLTRSQRDRILRYLTEPAQEVAAAPR